MREKGIYYFNSSLCCINWNQNWPPNCTRCALLVGCSNFACSALPNILKCGVQQCSVLLCFPLDKELLISQDYLVWEKRVPFLAHIPVLLPLWMSAWIIAWVAALDTGSMCLIPQMLGPLAKALDKCLVPIWIGICKPLLHSLALFASCLPLLQWYTLHNMCWHLGSFYINVALQVSGMVSVGMILLCLILLWLC